MTNELIVSPTARRNTLFSRLAQQVLTIPRYLPIRFTGGAVGPEEAPLRPEHFVSCIIPAYNEEEGIGAVLESLLSQTRPPDAVHVIVNNTTDDTVYESSKYEGRHRIRRRLGLMETNVYVHDIGTNLDKKVGALNYGYQIAQAEGAEFVLGVDGDTTLEKRCLEHLLDEMVGDSRIGGLSAIYAFENVKSGPVASFLLSAQKAQFAAFNMDHLLKSRTMSVLGGQCSIFRVKTLEMLCAHHHQTTPWTNDSEVEDSLLSIQIRTVGYQTKISATARAYVGPMLTLRSLYAQQVKWTAGGIKLMRQHPFHPNLRQKWTENIGMTFNIIVRLLFALLLVGSLSIGAFVFNPIWLIPPVLAWLLAVRVTASMHNRTWKDWLYSTTLAPSEVYMWLRATYFVASWWQVLNATERDNWGAQSAAESGKGGMGILWPLVVLGAVFGIVGYSWTTLSAAQQADVLAYGWPVLMVLTVMLTLGMMRKALRRHRSFTV